MISRIDPIGFLDAILSLAVRHYCQSVGKAQFEASQSSQWSPAICPAISPVSGPYVKSKIGGTF